jgi:hypothetical protein
MSGIPVIDPTPRSSGRMARCLVSSRGIPQRGIPQRDLAPRSLASRRPAPRNLAQRSLARAGLLAVTAVMALGLSSCLYSFRAGSGLPSHVRLLAIPTLDNDTDRLDLAQELQEAMQQEIPRAFGVRLAAEDQSQAVIRASIRRYSVDAPTYRPAPGGGAEVVERAVSISLQVQVIDQTRSLILWENTSLTARGVYLEASELEEDGRRTAIRQIVRDIINGLQSNW